MLERSVIDINRSLYVNLPFDACRLLGIEKGNKVKITLNNNKLIIEP
jgi:antitoxin component of MazEF toxin-antitoxin module